MFNGPEAVLGIVLAAAALLADFAAALARLAARGSASDVAVFHDDGTPVSRSGPDIVDNRLSDIDRSISVLKAALDGSKQALADTEASLDATIARAKSAEAAIEGIGHSRDRLQNALDQAAAAELEVRKIQDTLEVERAKGDDVAHSLGERVQEKREVDEQVAKREVELAELTGMLEQIRESGQGALQQHLKKEERLTEELGRQDEELRRVREERERLGEEAREMERRAETMSEQVSAATLALEETRLKLEKAHGELEKRRAEQEAVEKESAEVVARSAERERMKEKLREMEGELEETRRELRTRDKIVEEISLESDQLASLLAARDAELHEAQRRLESAVAVGEESGGVGGDAKASDLSLEEIRNNLDAEQRALSAEIARAELARSDIAEEDLDPLDRVEREMEAEGELLQAGLRKAESTVKREEHLSKRKQGAVQEVLESIGREEKEEGDESLKGVLEGISVKDAESELEASESGDGGDGDRVEGKRDELAVSKQAQSKASGEESKPKRRRGRPRKAAREGDVGGGDDVKKRRGRPRKSSSSSS